MICPNCGREIADMAVVCPNCGTPVSPQNQPNINMGEEKANVGFIILTIFFPIVGIILGIIEINKGNKSAGKTYLITAGIVVAVSFLGGCCCGILPALMGSSSSSSSYYALTPFLF